jgi:hypothetical protein
MAVAAGMRDRSDEAERLHREALAGYEGVGSVEGIAFSHAALGFLATKRGEVEEALELHRRSLAEAALGSERRAMALAVEGLAGSHAFSGDAPTAARLLGVAAELRDERIVSPPWRLADRARVEAGMRSLLGDDRYTALYESGRQQAETILARLVADARLVSG